MKGGQVGWTEKSGKVKRKWGRMGEGAAATAKMRPAAAAPKIKKLRVFFFLGLGFLIDVPLFFLVAMHSIYRVFSG